MASQLEPFTGEEIFAASPSRVFAALTDPDALAEAIPDKISHERVDDHTLRCTVRPGFSFVRANMRMMVTIAEAIPESDVVLQIASQGIGAGMNVDCRLRISPEESGSRIAWEARVNKLSGLITAVSPTLIRSAADKVIRDGWAGMRKQIEE